VFSRIDLTHEYVRAVQTYDLHYTDLKQMVRTSMEHTFLPGNQPVGQPGQVPRLRSVRARMTRLEQINRLQAARRF